MHFILHCVYHHNTILLLSWLVNYPIYTVVHYTALLCNLATGLGNGRCVFPPMKADGLASPMIGPPKLLLFGL